MGLISAKTAFGAYAVLALLAAVTLEGDSRLIALAVLAVFAVRTYVDIVRRRIQAREDAERSALATAPVADVSAGGDSVD